MQSDLLPILLVFSQRKYTITASIVERVQKSVDYITSVIFLIDSE